MTTDPPLITTVTDKDGQPIAYLFDQYRVLTPPEKISPTMKAALISVEDRRFYEHQGVDWKGTIRAGLTNQVSGAVTQGPSGVLLIGGNAFFNSSNSFGTNLSSTGNQFLGTVGLRQGLTNIVVAGSNLTLAAATCVTAANSTLTAWANSSDK